MASSAASAGGRMAAIANAIDYAKHWVAKAHSPENGTVNTRAERVEEILGQLDLEILRPIAGVEESIRQFVESDDVITTVVDRTVGLDGTGVCRSAAECYEVHCDTVEVDDIDDGPLPLAGSLHAWIGDHGDRETISYRLLSYDGHKAVYRFEID